MGIKVLSLWRVLAVSFAKVEVLKEPKQQWGHTMDPIEV
jgi:hypothetical protein